MAKYRRVFGIAQETSFEPSFSYEGDESLVNITQSVHCVGGVDYVKLIEKFGCTQIDSSILARFEALTESKRPLHPLLKQDIFYSHRDLELILDDYEQGKPFYLYTGRGPSAGSLHLGHLLPFTFTQYLQEVFGAPVVIQMTDDEKFLHRDVDLPTIRKNLIENVKDIIACGFDPEKTFIFSNFDYIGSLYPNVVRIEKMITNNQVRGCFGISGSDNIGKTSFPAIQAAPAFCSSFPVVLSQFIKKSDGRMRCLIPCGIDQDPYFRLTRDVASRLGPDFQKPALIHSKFMPSLFGIEEKMTSSADPNSAIFMTDSLKEVERKIMRHAFSGGQETRDLHRRLGGNPDVDIAFQLLRFFYQTDTNPKKETEKEEAKNNEIGKAKRRKEKKLGKTELGNLEQIEREYRSGTLMTSALKRKAVEVIGEVVARHRLARALVTDDIVRQFMTVRPLSAD